MKKLLLFLFAFFVIQCTRKPENKNPKVLSNEIELTKYDTLGNTQGNAMHYLGMYKGLMPGKKSDKTAIVLELSEVFVYTISADTLAKDKEVIEKGTFRWQPDGKSILLTSDNGIEMEFRVGKDKLTLISNSEEMIFDKMKSSEVITMESEATAAALTSFVDQKWNITSIDNKPINAKGIKKDYYVFFSKDRKLQAYAGCNKIGGDYTLHGEKIKITNIAATEMACAEMDIENTLIKTLKEVDNIIQNNQIMYLRRRGEALIKFEAEKHKK